ncbi:MAG: hypothetical protein D3924_08420 [Candidatus Electrothrix sp. AR4]|nr:hypothetical protein [Candidatus Electrothrix sp. AR4]
MKKETNLQFDAFIEEWNETPKKNKEVFLHLREHLMEKQEVTFEFIPRPGVAYSLRAAHTAQKKRGLFVMVDVIEDSPKWLSICFYGDMITGPEERGDFVPKGLLGDDAVCFDIEEKNEALVSYLEVRLDEAYWNASNA